MALEFLAFDTIKVPVPGFGALGLSASIGSNLNLEQAESVLKKLLS